MESNGKRYWRGIEELENDLEFVKNAEKEFSDAPTIVEDGSQPNRRDFLKLMGFSVAAVSVAACQAPVKKAIPYLQKPAELDPSIPNYYASTFFEDGDYASILVKTREGRPIKIEGNDLSAINGGKTSAKAQASLLSLYDIDRFKGFMKGKAEISMDKADEEIKGALESASAIRIVTPTIISPSTKAVIKAFTEKYKGAKLVMYDAISASGMLEANKESFGTAMIPSYDFSKAEVIVGINCDFLGTWISPVEFSRQYAQNRKVGKDKKKMSRFYALESRMSMTGANADYRTAIKPSQEGAVIASLYKKITGSDTFKDDKINKALDRIVKDLKSAQGKALVVSGSNDSTVQTVVNAINNELGSYGSTIDTTTPCYLRQGIDADMNAFIDEVKGGAVDAVIFFGTNPVYNHARGKELKDALGKIKTRISFAMRPNETSELCEYICPNHHYLESWGDAEPKKGHLSLIQPTITPIFKTRQAQESLLVWAGAKNTNYYDFVRSVWSKSVGAGKGKSFDETWANALHDGIFVGAVAKVEAKVDAKAEAKEGDKPEEKPVEREERPRVAGAFKGDVEGAISDIAKEYKADTTAELEIQLYEKVAIGSGMHANNPWLQEMPDPITRTCWGNYVCVSQQTAKKKELSQDEVVKVTVGSYTFELPVLIQPGQSNDTIAVALGYGRVTAGKVGKGIGQNVAPLINKTGWATAKLEKTGKYDAIAQTQTHHTIMGRDIIQEASLKEYQAKPEAGRNLITIHTDKGPKRPTDISLWIGHTYPNHSWSLMIDLNTCTGCGACVVACQVENNVPVVGKKEVLNRREMHWIRIDRYYSSDANYTAEQHKKGKEDGSYGDMEIPSDNPDVTFMPLMCQHCNNAPCETVCPVLATTHSNEGLNQMAYNRCVGTRYCANNCPFKVRRFNWFHYAEDSRFTELNPTQTNDLGRMVLNPDVTVRSRGVMEKCTMCIQRIQAGKLEAKKQKSRPKDGDIQTACSQVCPTNAIIFGDMLDENSQIGKLVAEEHDKRAYHLLEEINVKPQISYLTKIRNTDEAKARFAAEAHGGHKEHKEGGKDHDHKEGGKKEEHKKEEKH